MAKKDTETTVTRISAAGTKSPKKPASKNESTKKNAQKSDKKRRSFGPLGDIGGYFKGAWVELRQVHWPTRRATWGLTSAVLAFSLFFVILITLLDAGFKLFFEQILK